MPSETNELIRNPPRAFSMMPFWFWNDALDEPELLRQIADFDAHGVFGFVIHPRVGLPGDTGWMSDRYLRFCVVATAEARRRDMRVILYDEGMYPSGSSSGQVVARDPTLACRGLELRVDDARLAPGETLVATVPDARGRRLSIVDRKVDAYVRGLHYLGDGPREDEPPAGDILNPATSAAVLSLVYDRYHDALAEYFGNTIVGLFTDEPNALGKCREPDVRPGTTDVLAHVNRLLGDDFAPHLPALWLDDEPDAKRQRKRWADAISLRLEETWFAPLSDWCARRGVALCGHPERGDQLGVQRFFQTPGQDVVWRFIERDKPSALEGAESTQAKVTSSAMAHLGRARNSNEFCGAYGHETTFEEMAWLADWLLVRGVNLLVPHAFYYSIRGPRMDERPPQLGPSTPAWDDGRFRAFADRCRRLSWVNGDGARHVCEIAILTDPEHAAWHAARVCFEHQRDFNYIDPRTLLDRGEIADGALRIGAMRYRFVIVDGLDAIAADVTRRLQPMIDANRVIAWPTSVAGVPSAASAGASAEALLDAIRRSCAPDVELAPPAENVRVRHMTRGDDHFYILFNEGRGEVRAMLSVAVRGHRTWIDLATGSRVKATDALTLAPYAIALLHVAAE